MGKSELIADLQERIRLLESQEGKRGREGESGYGKSSGQAALFDGSIEMGFHGGKPLEGKRKRDCDHGETEHDGNAAFKKIVTLLNASDRSEKGLRERLALDGFQEQVVDDAVERAKALGFVDDLRYGEVLVRSRVSQGRGSAGIVRELNENGIDADCIPGWPYEFGISHEDEIERALDLLERKPPRSKNKREGAYRRLMQKGYPSSVASSAARTWAAMVECERP